MARAKIYYFTDVEQQSAVVGLALSHPARVRILSLLRKKRVVSYTEIARAVPLASATLCQHIGLLSRADLIESAPLGEGPAGYSLRMLAWEEASELLRELIAA